MIYHSPQKSDTTQIKLFTIPPLKRFTEQYSATMACLVSIKMVGIKVFSFGCSVDSMKAETTQVLMSWGRFFLLIFSLASHTTEVPFDPVSWGFRPTIIGTSLSRAVPLNLPSGTPSRSQQPPFLDHPL